MNESYRFRNLWTCNTVYIWLRRSSSLSRLVVKKLWNHTKAAGSPLNFKGKHSRMQDVYRCKALVKMPQKFNKETRFEYENHSWRKGATKHVFFILVKFQSLPGLKITAHRGNTTTKTLTKREYINWTVFLSFFHLFLKFLFCDSF